MPLASFNSPWGRLGASPSWGSFDPPESPAVSVEFRPGDHRLGGLEIEARNFEDAFMLNPLLKERVEGVCVDVDQGLSPFRD